MSAARVVGSGPGAAGRPARVLVVDDERALAGMVGTYLGRAGYDVELAHDGPGALAAAQRRPPDVVVLDVGLPGYDGVEVCRRLRTFTDCYVVMLTARGDELDVLVGLSVGADDYVTKPFSVRELVARVGVVLRRRREPRPGARRFGRLVVDVGAREVVVDGSPIALTKTEFDVLAALAESPRRVLTRRELAEAVWGPGWIGDEHLVDTHVAHIRAKLGDDAGAPEFVATVRGVGYRMVGG